nr:MAG TPA: hypothetical protein [Caudoviricetes sp.]
MFRFRLSFFPLPLATGPPARVLRWEGRTLA